VEFQDTGFLVTYDAVPRKVYEEKYLPQKTPIVIDCGAYEIRAGYASDPQPRLRFRSLVSRNRTKDGKGFCTLVGNKIPYAEAYRLKPRSPFDRNVICHFESMEHILDHVFDGLGINGSSAVDHPIILTEAVCNPNYSRAKMSQLLFECYHVPYISYGIGELFSYWYHHRTETKSSLDLTDGLIISSSHEVSLIIPILDGKPDFMSTACIPVGGLQSHRFLFDSLLLKYPQHARHLSLNRCHELANRFAALAPGDFLDELKIMQKFYGNEEKTGRTPQYSPIMIQLPFTEYKPKEETEEEKKKRLKRRKEHAERLRTLAAKRRESKLTERQQTLEGYDQLASQYSSSAISETEFLQQLKQGGFEDQDDFEKHHKLLRKKVEGTLARMQGEDATKEPQEEDDKNNGQRSEKERFPLLFVDPSTLTEDQKKEKRKQLLLKSAEAGRARRRREKEQAQQALEMREKQEQTNYEKNPQDYISGLHLKRQRLIEAREKRKSSERRKNLASKRRALRAVMGQNPSEKGEDDFGANEEDWQLYKKMAQSRGEIMGDDSASEEEKEELQWLEKLLQKYDPDTMKKELEENYPQAHDFQIELFVERVKLPEILYQPSIIGLEVTGLAEALEGVFRTLGAAKRDRASKNIVVVGGNSMYPNFCKRLLYHVRSICPTGLPVKVTHARSPVLGSWLGARDFVNLLGEDFKVKACITRKDYEEKGRQWFREHTFSNIYYPTPKK